MRLMIQVSTAFRYLLACFAILLAGLPLAYADGFIVVTEEVTIQPYPLPGPRPPSRPLERFTPLAVKEHHVTVAIDGQVARTTVDQVFHNPTKRRLEGTYLFPLPVGAEIDSFAMDVNGEMTKSELLDADKARKIYEDIVRKAKDPALLEYVGRGLYKARIFPIEPESDKRVKIVYTEILGRDADTVDYRYPLNTEKFSSQPIKSLGIAVTIKSDDPVATAYSPTHAVETVFKGNGDVVVGLEQANVRPDSDFQLFYKVEASGGERPGFDLMTYREADEAGFFLMLISPGTWKKDAAAVAKDMVFVIDTSGSMSGQKLEQVKEALTFCINQLNPRDRFEVVRFSTDVEPLFDGLAEVSAPARKRALEFVGGLKSVGGTAIDAVLRKGAQTASANLKAGRPSQVVFLTDGLPTIGERDEERILANAREALGEADGNLRIFTFGVGNNVNTHLLDKLTEETKAYSQYVLPGESIGEKVARFYTKISNPVLTALDLTFPDGVRASRMYPPALPDLFAGDQLIVLGRFEPSGSTSGGVTLSGQYDGETYRFPFDAAFSDAIDLEHDFIPRLWATRRVGYLMDEISLHGESDELKDEIVILARRYGIVTPYTSHLIIEDEAALPAGAQTIEADQELADGRSLREYSDFNFRAFNRDKSGAKAVDRARGNTALKSAPTVNAASESNIIAQRAEGFDTPSAMKPIEPTTRGYSVGRSSSSGAVDAFVGGVTASEGRARIPYEQKQAFRNGRNFIQRGDVWMDGRIPENPGKPVQRIAFNSDDYFDLLSKRPEVAEWYALGRNIQFILGDQIIEIFDDEEASAAESDG